MTQMIDEDQKRSLPSAMLLLGPTGSGKTPLGEYLAERGFRDRRCVHFDFGQNLRDTVASEGAGTDLMPAELDFLRDVLNSGALLENETFHIARRIFAAFCRNRELKSRDLVVLNGLPRHVGQATDVAGLATVRLVVCLECKAPTVFARIDANAGGDRTGRLDDSRAEVAAKLRLFNERTMPLLDHYGSRGVRIVRVSVTDDSTLESVVASVTAQLGEDDLSWH